MVLSMEHVEGGELFNYIVSQKKVKESIARKMFRQMASALDYCHKSCIIHRGKPITCYLINFYRSKTGKLATGC